MNLLERELKYPLGDTLPAPGESIERDGMRVEVLASDEMRVEQVRLSPVLAPATKAADEK